MQILPGLLSGIALIFFIEKSGSPSCYAEASTNGGITEFTLILSGISKRGFMDPFDQSLGKKSCSDGYVHGTDHFIITGFINITGYTLPKLEMCFDIRYMNKHDFTVWYPIWSTRFNLYEERCTDIQQVPTDKCGCKYESNITIRFKCNLTANVKYSKTDFRMYFQYDEPNVPPWAVTAYQEMPNVYRSPSCSSEASTNGESTIILSGISKRGFMDPFDHSLGKKSCSDGYVNGTDHFIITGFINITGYTLPQLEIGFEIRYMGKGYFTAWYPIRSTRFNLYEERCTDIQQVPSDKCGCKYESNITIRFKCNLTANVKYSKKPFSMYFQYDDPNAPQWTVTLYQEMPNVYRSSSCYAGASTNGGMSPHGGIKGMADFIFLVTALFCAVASMTSTDQ